jgi:hypothetical protein
VGSALLEEGTMKRKTSEFMKDVLGLGRDATRYFEEVLRSRPQAFTDEATRMHELLVVFGEGPVLEALSQCRQHSRFHIEYLEERLSELLTRASAATIAVVPSRRLVAEER